MAHMPSLSQPPLATLAADGAPAAAGQDDDVGPHGLDEVLRAAIRARHHELLVELEARVCAAGGTVHWARDADEARALVLALIGTARTEQVVGPAWLPTMDPTLTAEARREQLLDARIGVGVATAAAAETGTVCITTATAEEQLRVTLPDTVVTLLDVDRIVPRVADLEVVLQLATQAGDDREQPSVVLFTGVHRGDGPRAFHLVLVGSGTLHLTDADPDEAGMTSASRGDPGCRSTHAPACASARTDVLDRVRQAARGATAGTAQDLPRLVPCAPAVDLRARIAHFVTQAEANHLRVHLTTPVRLSLVVAELIAEAQLQRIAIPVGLDPDWLAGVLDRRQVTADLARIPHRDLDRHQLALTGASLGIAATGSVVLDAAPGQGRRALNLVPERHLCVLRAEHLVDSVTDAFARFDPRRPLTIVPGPMLRSAAAWRPTSGQTPAQVQGHDRAPSQADQQDDHAERERQQGAPPRAMALHQAIAQHTSATRRQPARQHHLDVPPHRVEVILVAANDDELPG